MQVHSLLPASPLVKDIVLSKHFTSMKKLFIDGVCVMHDVKENVELAAGMLPAGVNFKVAED